METVPREKIALMLFAAILLLMAGGIAAYLVVGHSWNYAATRIDDAAGEMAGYNVILYEGTATPAQARVDSQGLLAFAPASLASKARSYREKGATVYELDLVHPQRYGDPSIIGKEGYRIGIVSFKEGDTPVSKQERVDYLHQHGVDTLVAIVPSQAALAKVEGIDVFIDLNEHTPLASGQASPDGYRVAMPSVGSVGAIVISPSEVVSARTLSN